MTATPADPAILEDRPRRNVGAQLIGLQRDYPILQIAALVAIFLYGQATIDGFGSKLSIYSMLVLAALLGLAAVGQTIVILIGGIDFSIPALIVLGATLIVDLTSIKHWSFVPALILVIVLAVAIGAASGYISHRFQVQPLIVTLAIGAIVTGVVLVWSNGLTTGVAPAWLTTFTSPAGKTLGVGFPPIIALWAVVAVLVGIVLRATVTGRWVYATGSNPRAAELAIVPTRRVWTATFALSAVMAAMTGVLIAGFSGSASASAGDPYLWQSLTAVIVGGTTFGARGDYWRTVIGALILIELNTVLVGHNAGPATQQILSGVLILLVVALYGRQRPVRDRV
jgi:ribose transport system permease protein